jgi:hypothetical protein
MGLRTHASEDVVATGDAQAVAIYEEYNGSGNHRARRKSTIAKERIELRENSRVLGLLDRNLTHTRGIPSGYFINEACFKCY